jgi:hypothetical protein
MKVIHFDRAANYIELEDQCFMVLDDADHGRHVVPGKCAHRGGPLHLGHVDEKARSIICPWHQGKTNIARLVESALPAVSVPGRVTVVLNSQSQEAPAAFRRKMLLDCTAALQQLRGTR